MNGLADIELLSRFATKEGDAEERVHRNALHQDFEPMMPTLSMCDHYQFTGKVIASQEAKQTNLIHRLLEFAELVSLA